MTRVRSTRNSALPAAASLARAPGSPRRTPPPVGARARPDVARSESTECVESSVHRGNCGDAVLGFLGVAVYMPRLLLAKARQPRGVRIDFANRRFFLGPRAEFSDDPRQRGVLEGGHNIYFHLFRKAAGRLLPEDLVNEYTEAELKPSWRRRHGEVAARKITKCLTAPRLFPVSAESEARSLASLTWQGAKGEWLRLSPEEARRAAKQYAETHEVVERAFTILREKGALVAKRGVPGLGVGAIPARRVLEAVAPQFVATPLAARLLTRMERFAAEPPVESLDRAALEALGVPGGVPEVYVDPYGGLRLIDHHRIHGARDARVEIEVDPIFVNYTRN